MSDISSCPHHVRGEEVSSRPPYRSGRKPTAVKVYTIADESQHVLVFGVPAINLTEQVIAVAEKYGTVTVEKVENYPNLEEFTNLFHLHFSRLAEARVAKRKLDGLEFFGGILHVCYAPELEAVDETRSKIIQRSKQVHALIKNKRSKKFKGFEMGASSSCK